MEIYYSKSKRNYITKMMFIYKYYLSKCVLIVFPKFRQTVLPDKMSSFLNNFGQRKPKSTTGCGKIPKENPACDQLPSNEDEKLVRGYVV